jgi:hypothetical protein
MSETILEETGKPGAVVTDAAAFENMVSKLKQGRLLVSRRVLSPDLVLAIVDYLKGVGRASFPQWHPIAPGCPNFHRLNWNDQRSYVRGAFHQFSFFPWNQDVFQLFDKLRDVFLLRNKLCGAAPEAFLSGDPAEGAVARISAQFYPAGGGHMNGHTDPVSEYQLAVPTLAMSRYGRDFTSGGLWIDLPDSTRVFADPLLEPGDVIWFHPKRPHGVMSIDPEEPLNWLDFRGRWSGILAVNGLPGASGRAGVEVAGG